MTYDAQDRAVAYGVPAQPRYRYAADGQRYWRRTTTDGDTDLVPVTRDEYTALDGLAPSLGTRAPTE